MQSRFLTLSFTIVIMFFLFSCGGAGNITSNTFSQETTTVLPDQSDISSDLILTAKSA